MMTSLHCIKILLIALFVLSQQTKGQIFLSDKNQEFIKQSQEIKNQVVEQGEEIRIKLSDYFQGSLLQYGITLDNLNDPEYMDKDINELIYLSPPFSLIKSQPISKTIMPGEKTPFARTTLTLEEHTNLHFYLLDRSYMFYMFDITSYSRGTIDKIYQYQLNTTYLNGTCFDLTYLGDQLNSLIFFCKNYNITNSSSVTEFYTAVVIDQYNKTPVFRYFVVNYPNVTFDEEVGLRFIQIFPSPDYSSISQALFLGQKTRVQLTPIVLGVNLTEFQDMSSNNETLRIRDQGLFYYNNELALGSLDSQSLILDYTKVNDNLTMSIAYLIKDKGLILCQIFVGDINPSGSTTSVSCSFDNTKIVNIPNALSLQMNAEDSDHIFVTTSIPPGVFEINLSNLYIPFIQKIYTVNGDNGQYLGLQQVTSNNNFVIHMMEDVSTYRQVLRVFGRNGTYHNLARFDLPLFKKTQAIYLSFPNYYLNLVIIRDDINVNVTAFDDNKLVIIGTNSTLINKFYQNTINVTLTIQNKYETLNEQFNVTVVNASDLGVRSSECENFQTNIFYSCGDENFEYIVQDYYNGPYYVLQSINDSSNANDSCSNGSCFFMFQNQDFRKNFYQQFDFSKCHLNFFYNYLYTNNSQHQTRMIIVCADDSQSIVSSYTICVECNEVEKTNEIQMPDLTFMQYGYDSANRMLFIMASNANSDYTDYIIELHFFQIQNHVEWKSMSNPQFYKNAQLSTIQSFNYDPSSGNGVLVDALSSASLQYIAFFKIDYTTLTLSVLVSDEFNILSQNMILKALVANDWFIYTMQLKNSIGIYEARQSMSSTIRSMYQQSFYYSYIIYDFDIYDDKYLVLFVNRNQMDVYEISMDIYLTFKMTLPLYNEFNNYNFFTQLVEQKGTRSYANGIFSILLYSSTYLSSYSYQLFVYQLDGTQHNSFIMVQNLTDVFQGSSFWSITIKQSFSDTEVGILSDVMVTVYYARFYNAIILNPDYPSREMLLANCSNIKSTIESQMSANGTAQQITSLKIRPVSLFNSSNVTIPDSQEIQINIFTENQGFAITPAVTQIINSSYSNELRDYMNSDILLENYVDGHNVGYSFLCSYHDEYGNLQDCSTNGLSDQTQTLPYNFYLEFVTSFSEVVKSISLNKVFFMFDSKYQVNLLRLPRNKQQFDSSDPIDLDSINGFPLDNPYSVSELTAIGCVINSNVKYFLIYRDNSTTNAFSKYLLIFQCEDILNYYIKLATIIVYDDQSLKDYVQFQLFDNYLTISNNMIDIEKVQTVVESENYFQLYLAMTSEVLESYSNIFWLYNVTFNCTDNTIFYTLLDKLSAEHINQDSFMVRNLLAIPDSGLLIITTEGTELYIYDSMNRILLVKYDISNDDPFIEQSTDNLQIMNVVANWPYTFHIITNNGIFIYNFYANLSSRADIFPYFKEALTPMFKKILRYQIDQIDQEIASNQFGYAFLVTVQTPGNNFEVYIAAISFYSGSNAQIFKMIKIQDNQACMSLQQEPYLQSNPEDQIVVSLICNTQMYIVRICMRPHVIIDLSSFSLNATRAQKYNDITKYDPGLQQFNQYNLTIISTNEFNNYGINTGTITINLEFQFSAESQDCLWLLPINIGFLIIFLVLALSIIIMQANLSKPKNEFIANQITFNKHDKREFDWPRLDLRDRLSTNKTVITEDMQDRESRKLYIMSRKDKHRLLKKRQSSLRTSNEISSKSDGLIEINSCQDTPLKLAEDLIDKNYIDRRSGAFAFVDENSKSLKRKLTTNH